jgi:LemA protein
VFVANSLGFSQASYFDVENADSLNQIKDFTTDDGTILRQKLSNAGSMVLNTTKTIGNSIEQNGRVLLERGKNEIKKHSDPQNGQGGTNVNGDKPE